MNEFIKKLIERLGKLGWVYADYYPDETAIHRLRKKSVAYDEVVEIINQLAGEYKQNIDQDLMIVESLPSLYPLQPFEEEALHKVVSRAKDSGVWISCSTDMPEHDQEVFIKFSDGAICNGRFWIVEGTNYCGFNTKFGLFVAEQVAEWKPIATYQPKGE